MPNNGRGDSLSSVPSFGMMGIDDPINFVDRYAHSLGLSASRCLEMDETKSVVHGLHLLHRPVVEEAGSEAYCVDCVVGIETAAPDHAKYDTSHGKYP